MRVCRVPVLGIRFLKLRYADTTAYSSVVRIRTVPTFQDNSGEEVFWEGEVDVKPGSLFA